MSEVSASAGGAPARTAGPDPRRWLILGVIGIAQLMVMLDITIVNIALPSAQRSLGFSTRGPAVGGDRLRARVRQPAAVRRADRRPDRPQDHVPGRPDRLRRRVGRRRRGDQFRHAGDGARLPGRVRRVPGPGGAGAADHDVQRPEGAGQGVRCLRGHRRQRRGGRPRARRAADRVPVLALVPVREPVLRRDRGRRRAAAAAAPPGPGSGRGWTCSASCWSLPRCSAWSTGSPMPPPTAGTRRPPTASWPRACGCWPRSAVAGPRGQPAAAAPGRRWTATAAAPTWRC